MAETLRGKIVAVEKVETATMAMSAAEALNDLNPGITEGPGRKLGLRGL
ncbi:MAG TPA: hypothetical protein VGR28_06380 [Candidatus Thermoplasmatota archaeon]|jgi:hypothetical protein|nr:hypothetical protein [Candidatus Thermoplasmatota archaeon]